MPPRPLLATLVAVLALAAGCGEGGPTAQQPPSTTAAAGGPPPPFPATVEAENGPVVLAERPERIVSLSPTATETLFAIGAGDEVVAVDGESDHPADAPRTELSGFEPNVEAIAAYAPDLVVAGFDPGSLVDGLEKIGVPVLLQPAASDLEDAYEQIEELGTATGHATEAEELVESMDERIDALAASVADAAGSPVSVYHELGPDFFSATSRTFIGSVYRALGLENIADDADAAAPDYPQLSAEHILAADPDLVVLADTECCGQTAEKVAARPGWRRIAAVREGHVLEVDDDVASRWGPRTVDFVELVVEALEDVREG